MGSDGNNECKLKISVDNFEMELVGSEGFVKEYEAKFSLVEKVEKLAKRVLNENGVPEISPNGQTPEGGDVHKENPFPHVLDLSEEKPKITVNKIPGDSRKDKQVKVALLYLLGMKLKTGNREEIPTKEIREQCEEHGCLDKANIAKYLREKKKLFSIGGNQTIRLTAPGESEAKQLAKQLNNEQSE